MPIEGVTDRRILPRLGKIRTGVKKKSAKGNDYPEEVPYFVLNPVEEVLDKNGIVVGTRENEHMKALIQMFGEKPYELQIVFPSDNIEAVADANLKWWAGDVVKKKASLMCKGNGRFANYRGSDKVSGLDLPPGSYPEGMNRLCDREKCPQAVSGKCKPNLNLLFVVPEYSLFGVFQVNSTSTKAITAIWSSIELARNALRMEGISSIVGVPMRLFRERTPNQHDGVNYILKVEVNLEGLKREKAKFLSREKSTLALAIGNYVVDPIDKDIPDYDLLPQSSHGNFQTGEIALESLDISNDSNTEMAFWKDPEVVLKFKKLSDKTGTPLTDARMEATAAKFDTKEELETYLDSKLK